MASVTNFPVVPWQIDGLQSYKRYEAVDGINATDPYFYYATTDVPSGAKYNPSGIYSYSCTDFVYKDNLVTFLFTQTGLDFFQPNSMVAIEGSRGYTGQILDGGDGFVTFARPNWDEAGSYTSNIKSTVHPYWTIGFPSTPDYTSSLKGQSNVNTVSFGDGYSQRQSSAINANGMQFDLVFKNRGDMEAMSIMNFVEDKAGVQPFILHLPNQNIFHDTRLQVIANSYSHSMNSYNLNDLTVPVTKVFDI